MIVWKDEKNFKIIEIVILKINRTEERRQPVSLGRRYRWIFAAINMAHRGVGDREKSNTHAVH